MVKVKIQEIEQTKEVGLFTICFEGNGETEFEKFVMKFKNDAELNQDLQDILKAIQKMISAGSFLKRYFQAEDDMSDHLEGFYIERGKRSVYCLRVLDNVLIVGNCGVKTTNDEDADLTGYVTTLQTLDALLKEAIRNGVVSIEETENIN